MDLGDLLDCGADFAIKEFVRRELIRQGVDVDNWRRKSASALSGAVGSIMGGLLGGPLGFILGAMLSTYATSVPYAGDRSPEDVKNQYREAARMKALERCMQIVADDAPAGLHQKFRQAFASASERYRGYTGTYDSYALESAIDSILSSVDYNTARKFSRLYGAAKDVIG